jgi:phosphoribosylformylglycinamidine synthase subunit PurS
LCSRQGTRTRIAAAYPIGTINQMKARVYVSFKTTVLDPQGQTITHALNSLGHKSIAAVRQGKFFDVEISTDAAPADARREIDQIAHDVLANPVIEDYRVEFLD